MPSVGRLFVWAHVVCVCVCVCVLMVRCCVKTAMFGI